MIGISVTSTSSDNLSRLRRLVLASGVFLAACGAVRALDIDLVGPGDASPRVVMSEAERLRWARRLDTHDFESHPGPGDNDLDRDGWPDFWEPVPAIDRPEYLYRRVRIEDDDTGQRPGLYRGRPGKVLRIGFDGTGIVLRTRMFMPVDADVAYELSAWTRDARLTDDTRLRVSVQWFALAEGGARLLGRSDIPGLRPGQADWTESPWRLTIDAPPPGADAARLEIEVSAVPGRPLADRHGTVWFDDIALVAKPSLHLELPSGGQPARRPGPVVLPPGSGTTTLPGRLAYAGLKPLRGNFTRVVEVADVSGTAPTDEAGRALEQPFAARRAFTARAGRFEEPLTIAVRKRGVYYLAVRLYDEAGRLAGSTTRAVAVEGPAPDGLGAAAGIREVHDTLGASLTPLPNALARSPEVLLDWMRRARAGLVRLPAWPSTASAAAGRADANAFPGYVNPDPLDFIPEPIDPARSMPGLRSTRRDAAFPSAPPTLAQWTETAMRLRVDGARLTGIWPAPETVVRRASSTPSPVPAASAAGGAGAAGAAPAEDTPIARWRDALERAMLRVGTVMDSWEWPSGLRPGPGLEAMREAAAQATGGLPQAWPLTLPAAAAGGGFLGEAVPDYAAAVALRVPPDRRESDLVNGAAGQTPWVFERFRVDAWPRVYAPEDWTRLAPPPPDPNRPRSRPPPRPELWLDLEAAGAAAPSRDRRREREQMVELLRRTVLARALGARRVFAGPWFDAPNALTAPPGPGDPPGTYVPRPAALAAATATEVLAGTEYAGTLALPYPSQAHVFVRRDADEAVLVVWQDRDEPRPLERADLLEGPYLTVTDWAGNRMPCPPVLSVTRLPQFVTGMGAALARTLLSIRLAPDRPLFARADPQDQVLEGHNHLATPLPGALTFSYAVRAESDGLREVNWRVSPERLAVQWPTLPTVWNGPGAPPPFRSVFSVVPDPNAATDVLRLDGTAHPMAKQARFTLTIDTALPARARLYRRIEMRSEVEVEARRIMRSGAEGTAVVQLRMRWFPESASRQTMEMTPYWSAQGALPTRMPRVTLAAQPAARRGDERLPFAVAEVPLPLGAARSPGRIWVGLEEEGGSRFWRADATDFVRALAGDL